MGKLMDMVEVFEGLEDWRNAQQTRHRLSELLTIAVCAVLSGADDFEDISQWGRIKCKRPAKSSSQSLVIP